MIESFWFLERPSQVVCKTMVSSRSSRQPIDYILVRGFFTYFTDDYPIFSFPKCHVSCPVWRDLSPYLAMVFSWLKPTVFPSSAHSFHGWLGAGAPRNWSRAPGANSWIDWWRSAAVARPGPQKRGAWNKWEVTPSILMDDWVRLNFLGKLH